MDGQPPVARQTIWTLQLMRGVAALLVVASHTGLIMGQPEYGALRSFPLATKGWIGVNFFFVLSGFIILFAHVNDLGRPDRLINYAWRRFSRLYPVYWIFLALYVWASLSGFGPVNFSLAPKHLLTAVTLVQWVTAPLIPLRVAWTLIYEVFFYGMFAIAILDRRIGLAVFVLWAAVILVDSLVLHGNEMGWKSMWNINFFLGAGAFMLFRHADAKLGIPLLIVGMGMILVLFEVGLIYDRPDLQQAHPFALLLLGIPFAAILLGGAVAERAHGFNPPAWLRLAGDASYAIYLTHSATISALCRLNQKLLPGIVRPDFLFACIFVIATLIGVLAHLVVERPIVAICRRVIFRGNAGLPLK